MRYILYILLGDRRMSLIVIHMFGNGITVGREHDARYKKKKKSTQTINTYLSFFFLFHFFFLLRIYTSNALALYINTEYIPSTKYMFSLLRITLRTFLTFI